MWQARSRWGDLCLSGDIGSSFLISPHARQWLQSEYLIPRLIALLSPYHALRPCHRGGCVEVDRGPLCVGSVQSERW